jgi:hypothetical protein
LSGTEVDYALEMQSSVEQSITFKNLATGARRYVDRFFSGAPAGRLQLTLLCSTLATRISALTTSAYFEPGASAFFIDDAEVVKIDVRLNLDALARDVRALRKEPVFRDTLFLYNCERPTERFHVSIVFKLAERPPMSNPPSPLKGKNAHSALESRILNFLSAANARLAAAVQEVTSPLIDEF